MASQETRRPAFPNQEEPYISYGLPFPQTCRKHIDETFKASKIYVIVSSSLARNTSSFKELQSSLGDKIVGVRVGMRSHTYMSEVLDVVNDARNLDVDLIVTLGGGSLADAAKIVSFALGNDVNSPEDLMRLPRMNNRSLPANPPRCPIICIPTTLSGGEYSNYAGVTRDSDNNKFQFCPPLKGPALIILDAALATSTPLTFWLASGVRAVDHCVEAFCGLDRDKESDEACLKGLRCLVPGLLACAADPMNATARHECQLGVNFSMVFLQRGMHAGASHGIGHMVGPLGVGHGETSCVLLPAVCKFNAKYHANVERQTLVAKELWGIDVAREKFEAKGLEEFTADLGDLIDAFLKELGMPRSLEEVGVGRDKFDSLAVNCLDDEWCTLRNPVPLQQKEQVMEILEMCATSDSWSSSPSSTIQ